MKEIKTCVDDADASTFLLVFGMNRKSRRVATRQHKSIRFHDAAGKICEKRMNVYKRPVVAIEAQTSKKKPLYSIVTLVLMHYFDEGGVVFLMDGFVCLEIDGPCAGAVEKSDVRLLSKDVAARFDVGVPCAGDDANFWTADGLDEIQSAVDALAEGNYKLVDNRQDRANALHDRIVERHRIANKSEPGNSHSNACSTDRPPSKGRIQYSDRPPHPPLGSSRERLLHPPALRRVRVLAPPAHREPDWHAEQA